MSYDAISPIDGRYREEAQPISKFFSDRALAGERFRVELAYLELLMKLGIAPRRKVPRLSPSLDELKALEGHLGHDVKAVEVSLRDSLKKRDLKELAPFVHLGLTSEDTNSLAFASLLGKALREVLVPAYSSLAKDLARLARDNAGAAMLARTHGRPAVPTTFGKELAVFAVRVAERVASLSVLKPTAKFSGAVGTYASFSLMGNRDWPSTLGKFVKGMGVDYATYSTQVVPWERHSDILHCIVNLNQLMVSLSRDLWFYQALEYVHFRRPGKVSSSTMPQKVNPVDLENAEGQAEISNSIITLLAYRPQVTRMQRDLSDSVIRRMTGQGLAHSLVACERLRRSLASLSVDSGLMSRELHSHPEVLAEAAQISMRLKGEEEGYEKAKALVEAGRLAEVSLRLKPIDYLGEAPRLARECPDKVAEILRATP